MLYMIINTHARSGKLAGIRQRFEQEFAAAGLECSVFETEYAGHARELADLCCTKIAADSRLAETDKTGYLLAAGGDGTFNEIVNGMHDFDRVRLCLIPMGSGNDLGRGLGISSKDPAARLRYILAEIRNAGQQVRVRRMDLGQLTLPDGTRRRFAISAGIGVDAAVCKDVDSSRLKGFLNRFGLGSLTYVILTVANIFYMPLYDGELETGDGQRRSFRRIIFCAAMNQPCEGGGVPMTPDASPEDGKLSICAVHSIPRLKCFFALPMLVAAKHQRLRGFEIFDAESVAIRLAHPMTVHADGEYCGEWDALEFSCLPGIVQVMQ